VAVTHLAVRIDAGCAHRRERRLEALLRSLAGAVLVRRPVPEGRVQCRHDDEYVLFHALRAAADLVQERPAAYGLVGDHENPALAPRVRRRHLGNRPLAAPTRDDPPRDQRGLDDEDAEPDPYVDEGAGNDPRRVEERDAKQPESLTHGAEPV